jgi:hypothetical protein
MADDTTTDETTDDTEEQEEFEAPDQATWSRTTEALSKANAEAKKWRLRAQGKDEKWAVPGWTKPPADEDTEEDDKPAAKPRRQPRVDVDAVRREAEEAALTRAKPGLVRSAAKDALKDAGLILPEKGSADSAYQRAFRLFDMDAIFVDEDGTVTGVEDQIKAVRRDYPELFAKRGGARVNAGAGSTAADGAGGKTPSSSDKLAAMLLGKG